MAISSYKVFLMKGTGTGTVTWEKLVDIKSHPAMGGAPNLLDATTLSNKMRVYINGIQDLGDGLPFTANYDPTEYQTLKALEGQQNQYALWFGGTETGGVLTPDGSMGKFSWTGELSVYVDEAGVDEVEEMQITIAPSTDITFEV